jgi:hypothetical protein
LIGKARFLVFLLRLHDRNVIFLVAQVLSSGLFLVISTGRSFWLCSFPGAVVEMGLGGEKFQLGTVGALSLSVVSSVSIVICNKALMSSLGFNFGMRSNLRLRCFIRCSSATVWVLGCFCSIFCSNGCLDMMLIFGANLSTDRLRAAYCALYCFDCCLGIGLVRKFGPKCEASRVLSSIWCCELGMLLL